MKHPFLDPETGESHPVTRPGREPQVAALCYRATPEGKDVLLITSRDTGRWIVPKGWPIDGLDGPGAALQEAWEEAGVAEAEISPKPLGLYDYDKGVSDGESVPVTVTVYLARVTKLRDTYPEVDERTRRWVASAQAATMVDEPELRDILRNL
ncbi:NUDIX hydrolase [Sulfitobacter sp. HNIBRBA3233]|uniref:NUDIX hydrolase n=1 Tax=Sulfitobacter marinivivus TaxID=3158558 RepID=UPI0032DEBB84